jgi:chemotaxis signal transduction protein
VTSGLVSCIVGATQYAMRGTDIREIVRAERMRRTSLPGTPGRRDGTIGTLAINGDTIPVYALSAILDGVPPAESAAPTGHHIVVTPGAQGPVGWLADRVVRSQLTDRLDVLPLPVVIATGAAAWFEGVLIVDGTPLLLLAPRQLDPRATRQRPDAPVTAAEPDDPSAPMRGDAGPPLVVKFSSPALPSCGSARYALSARRIAAVVQSLAITPVPGCPPHLSGVAVWRGQVTPVVDFRSADERRTAVGGNRFLIARCGRPLRGGSVAFAVDSELVLHKPTLEDREVDDAEPTPAFVAGTFNVSGDRLALLDLDTLLLTRLEDR